ncbi:hypothetical protein ACZ75_19290 [Massilia sp. NR 4-1]|nr:hypothetical protein ACZ75_19290 [Massilia sp. NR 4-1]
MFVRYLEQDTATEAWLQILFQGAPTVAGAVESIPKGRSSTIYLKWDPETHEAVLKINDKLVPGFTWKKTSDGKYIDWTPENQLFAFAGRANDIFGKLVLKNKKGDILLNHEVSEWQAWNEYVLQADKLITTLQNCSGKSDEAAPCNVETGSRGDIVGAARTLALAYNISAAPKYLDAAKQYVDKLTLLEGAKLGLGGEWSMGGRVAAMGTLYDWLHNNLDEVRLAKLALRIKETVSFSHPNSGDILSVSLCGYQGMTMSPLKCTLEPVYQNWDRANPNQKSIAHSYLGAHNFSAISNLTIGLLAIAPEHPDVLPALETSYQHFLKGFLPAREFISGEGGHHMGFAYGSGGELIERIIMWRRALEATAPSLFSADWQYKLIYPYIYGLRADGRFPARGDNFDTLPYLNAISNMALWAATQNNDKVAQGFYSNSGRNRGWSKAPLVWDRLLFGKVAYEPEQQRALPKSRLFGVAGEVVMRDTWDGNATILEFKSSNFVSQNHQHLDQNSFSLFYKSPLLIDSGLYDNYGNSHWSNYYTRTIAHNSILVYDPSEIFSLPGDTILYNDGGQWFKNPQTTYPTMEEVRPGGPNYLDGVSNFEDGLNYSYVKGNASKAYAAQKMDQNTGFLRSIVYLRKPSFWNKPVALIFDSVTTEKLLPANSLLHMATEPVARAPKEVANEGGGRFRLRFNQGQQPAFTILNGGGLATVQVVLPENANIVKVGGVAAGNNCRQIGSDAKVAKPMDPANLPAGYSVNDCRFTAPYPGGNGYANYPVLKSGQQSDMSDVGAWRLEIMAPQAPTEKSPQFFLNVVSVDDNTNGQAATMPEVVRLTNKTQATAEVLQIGSRTLVAFNRGTAPASSISWSSSISGSFDLLAVGMKPSTRYELVSDAGGSKVELKENANGSYWSSDQGVVNIGF